MDIAQQAQSEINAQWKLTILKDQHALEEFAFNLANKICYPKVESKHAQIIIKVAKECIRELSGDIYHKSQSL